MGRSHSGRAAARALRNKKIYREGKQGRADREYGAA